MMFFLRKSLFRADLMFAFVFPCVPQEEPERKLSRKQVAIRRQKLVSGSKSK